MYGGRKVHIGLSGLQEGGEAAVPHGGIGGAPPRGGRGARRAVGELPQAPGNKGIGGLLSLIFSPRWSKSRTIEG